MNDLVVFPKEINLTFKPQDTFPLSKEMQPEIKFTIDQIGSGQTLFMDGMVLNDEPNIPKKMSMILAQVDDTDMGLKQNYFKREIARWKFNWMKRIVKIFPITPLKLKIEQYELEFEDAKKHYAKGLIRKEALLKRYQDLRNIFGVLDLTSLEKEEPRSQIMRLFVFSINATLERGQPVQGLYLFAAQTKLITPSQLYHEMKEYCFEEDNKGNVKVRLHTLKEEEEFIERMADKYGGRRSDSQSKH